MKGHVTLRNVNGKFNTKFLSCVYESQLKCQNGYENYSTHLLLPSSTSVTGELKFRFLIWIDEVDGRRRGTEIANWGFGVGVLPLVLGQKCKPDFCFTVKYIYTESLRLRLQGKSLITLLRVHPISYSTSLWGVRLRCPYRTLRSKHRPRRGREVQVLTLGHLGTLDQDGVQTTH